MGLKDWISNWVQPDPVRHDPWDDMNKAIGSEVHASTTAAIDVGAERERKRIVEYLRRESDNASLAMREIEVREAAVRLLGDIATSIEKGEHVPAEQHSADADPETKR